MTESHDLRAFLRAVGGVSRGSLLASPGERLEVEVPVRLLDEECSKVEAAPLGLWAFVDGIQSAATVTHLDHRPVYLYYTAAGAVGARGVGIAVDEHLAVLCSWTDADWARDVAGTIDVELLDEDRPGEIERLAFGAVGAAREEAERRLIHELAGHGESAGALLLDGSLVGRPVNTSLFGVVKTTKRRYLPDESILWGLREGWRSPRFEIPAGTGHKVPRYSCYLRLFDARGRGWDFGLIRLEAFDAGDLDALASRCLVERQGPGAADGRWDRHLGGVRAVETFLRSRRPAVFN